MQYDLNSGNNIMQVFGSKYWTYPFPFYLTSGMPVGDGINWVTRQMMIDEIEAVAGRWPFVTYTPQEGDEESWAPSSKAQIHSKPISKTHSWNL